MSAKDVVSIVQAAVFVVAATSLLSIWIIGAPGRRGEAARDSSILFLSIACFIWSLMAVLQLLLPANSDETSMPVVFRTLLSTVNSAFILGATAGLEAFEESAPRLLKKWLAWLPNLSFQGQIWVVMGIFAVFGFIASMVAMLLPKSKYGSLPDILLSAAVLAFVLTGLFLSFRKRGFNVLAGLSVVVVGLYIVVEFAEAPWAAKFLRDKNLEDYRWVANLSNKTMLCLLFMALIVSWMYEKAAKKSTLRILAPRQTEDGTMFEIQVAGSFDKVVVLTEKGYLRALEIARKFKKLGRPVPTAELYRRTSDDEVRQDIAKILEQTRIDPLFGRPGPGFRSLQAGPADITIDEGIRESVSWENAEFAKAIFGEPKKVFEVDMRKFPPKNDPLNKKGKSAAE